MLIMPLFVHHTLFLLTWNIRLDAWARLACPFTCFLGLGVRKCSCFRNRGWSIFSVFDALGLAQCAELCWQLRGEAGKRQVPSAKVALQHNLGLGGAAVVSLYRMGFPEAARWAFKPLFVQTIWPYLWRSSRISVLISCFMLYSPIHKSPLMTT